MSSEKLNLNLLKEKDEEYRQLITRLYEQELPEKELDNLFREARRFVGGAMLLKREETDLWSGWEISRLSLHVIIDVLKDEDSFYFKTVDYEVKGHGLSEHLVAWKIDIVELATNLYYKVLDFYNSKGEEDLENFRGFLGKVEKLTSEEVRLKKREAKLVSEIKEILRPGLYIFKYGSQEDIYFLTHEWGDRYTLLKFNKRRKFEFNALAMDSLITSISGFLVDFYLRNPKRQKAEVEVEFIEEDFVSLKTLINKIVKGGVNG